MFSSGSQITLVNPEHTTELTLSTRSVLNTTFLIEGKSVISVSTLDPAASVTKITDSTTNQLLVTIKRKTFRSDAIIFEQHYNGESLKLKDWLQEVKTSDGHMKWIINTPAGTFAWRMHVELRLALSPENDPEHPIAWLQLGSSTAKFALILKCGTEDFRDEIVASFIILEQQMRLKEKQSAIADGWNAGNRSVFGMHVNTGDFNRR